MKILFSISSLKKKKTMNVVIYNQNTSLSVADSIDPSSILDTHLDMTTLMTGFQNSTAEGNY